MISFYIQRGKLASLPMLSHGSPLSNDPGIEALNGVGSTKRTPRFSRGENRGLSSNRKERNGRVLVVRSSRVGMSEDR